MQVILDTSVLLANLRGTRASNDLKLVLADARAKRFTLVVPGLVLEETINKRRDAAEEGERHLRKAQSELSTLGAKLDLPAVDVSSAVKDFRKATMRLLTGNRVEIRDLPKIGHDDLVQRALARRKPFNAKGAGYRDALIWETVLAAASSSSEPVILVSNNWRDFGSDKDGKQFAQDLVHDLEKQGAVERVRLVPTLAAFRAEFVSAETVAATELEDALNSSTGLREVFLSRIEDRLDSHVFDRYDVMDQSRDWDWDHMNLPFGTEDVDLEGATLGGLDELYGVWVLSAQVWGDEVLFEFEAEVDAQVELELDLTIVGDPYDPEEPWHLERERRTIYRTAGKTLLLGGEATYARDLESLSDVGVHSVRL